MRFLQVDFEGYHFDQLFEILLPFFKGSFLSVIDVLRSCIVLDYDGLKFLQVVVAELIVKVLQSRQRREEFGSHQFEYFMTEFVASHVQIDHQLHLSDRIANQYLQHQVRSTSFASQTIVYFDQPKAFLLDSLLQLRAALVDLVDSSEHAFSSEHVSYLEENRLVHRIVHLGDLVSIVFELSLSEIGQFRVWVECDVSGKFIFFEILIQQFLLDSLDGFDLLHIFDLHIGSKMITLLHAYILHQIAELPIPLSCS
jgi:hypothetical protein